MNLIHDEDNNNRESGNISYNEISKIRITFIVSKTLARVSDKNVQKGERTRTHNPTTILQIVLRRPALLVIFQSLNDECLHNSGLQYDVTSGNQRLVILKINLRNHAHVT